MCIFIPLQISQLEKKSDIFKIFPFCLLATQFPFRFKSNVKIGLQVVKCFCSIFWNNQAGSTPDTHSLPHLAEGHCFQNSFSTRASQTRAKLSNTKCFERTLHAPPPQISLNIVMKKKVPSFMFQQVTKTKLPINLMQYTVPSSVVSQQSNAF